MRIIPQPATKYWNGLIVEGCIQCQTHDSTPYSKISCLFINFKVKQEIGFQPATGEISRGGSRGNSQTLPQQRKDKAERIKQSFANLSYLPGGSGQA